MYLYSKGWNSGQTTQGKRFWGAGDLLVGLVAGWLVLWGTTCAWLYCKMTGNAVLLQNCYVFFSDLAAFVLS